MPRLELAPRHRDRVARAALGAVARDEHDALRTEASKTRARLPRARHDDFVVTELAAVSPLEAFSLLEDDEPLDSLAPELLEPEPLELDDVPVDSELEDPEPLDVEPVDVSLPPEVVPDPFAVVDSDFSAVAFSAAAFSAAALRAAARAAALRAVARAAAD
ncbi:MAG TPA: hypothetical protein VH115_04180, partial [Solirubrobacteraceae bacterium]|nr:hypothetical protein [Solirubrobacteraceae bacterium]